MRKLEVRLLCRRVLIMRNENAHCQSREELLDRIGKCQRLFENYKTLKTLLPDQYLILVRGKKVH